MNRDNYYVIKLKQSDSYLVQNRFHSEIKDFTANKKKYKMFAYFKSKSKANQRVLQYKPYFDKCGGAEIIKLNRKKLEVNEKYEVKYNEEMLFNNSIIVKIIRHQHKSDNPIYEYEYNFVLCKILLSSIDDKNFTVGKNISLRLNQLYPWQSRNTITKL